MLLLEKQHSLLLAIFQVSEIDRFGNPPSKQRTLVLLVKKSIHFLCGFYLSQKPLCPRVVKPSFEHLTLDFEFVEKFTSEISANDVLSTLIESEPDFGDSLEHVIVVILVRLIVRLP
jgi:hypothetical protein